LAKFMRYGRTIHAILPLWDDAKIHLVMLIDSPAEIPKVFYRINIEDEIGMRNEQNSPCCYLLLL
jgi:hypothetical protein